MISKKTNLDDLQQPSATSASSPLNLLHVDGVSAADQMAALLGPEQVSIGILFLIISIGIFFLISIAGIFLIIVPIISHLSFPWASRRSQHIVLKFHLHSFEHSWLYVLLHSM